MKSFILLLCFIILISCAKKPPETHLQSLEVKLHYAMAGDVSIVMDKEKIHYLSQIYGKSNNAEIALTETKLKQFRESLDQIKIWNWQREYQIVALDGMWWEVKIIYPDHQVISKGSNAYPNFDSTQSKDSKETESFKVFLKALSDLTGKEVQ